MSTDHHYLFIHSDTSGQAGSGAKWFLVTNYSTTATNGMQTNDLVSGYASALGTNSNWSVSGDLNDQGGNEILSDFPIGQFDDETTRGSAYLNVVEIRAEGTYSSTVSEVLSEVSTIMASSTYLSLSDNISNIDQWSSASVNLSVLSTSSYTYTQSENSSNYPSDFASAMSGNEDYATDYWSKASNIQDDRIGAKTQVISKIATNSDDILEFIVKNSLTHDQIHKLYIQLVRDEIITQ